jgi:hypothetical protein
MSEMTEDTIAETTPAGALVEPQVEEALQPELDEAPTPRAGVTPHPLSPGGKRFEAIYAKGKQAEREVTDLRERLTATEAKLEALSKQPTPEAEKEYSWAELDQFIAQGRITRADAEAHRESILERRLLKKAEERQVNRTQETTREQILDQTVQGYLAAVPAVLEESSADRQRLEEEFEWVASIQGLNPAKLTDLQRKTVQATALRNVFGPIDSLQRKVSVKTETHQGISGGRPAETTSNPDQKLLDGLSKTQVLHYKKMMTAGRYQGGWKDVVAELKFTKPSRRVQ